MQNGTTPEHKTGVVLLLKGILTLARRSSGFHKEVLSEKLNRGGQNGIFP